MQKIIAIALIGVLLFGCINTNTDGKTNSSSSWLPTQNKTQATKNTTTVAPVKKCSDSYAISLLKNGTLSKSSVMSITAKCATGKIISAYVDGIKTDEKTVNSDSETVNLKLMASKDGTQKVEIKSNSKIILTKDWTVEELGYTKIKGLENDPISVKQWKAIGFEVENPVTLRSADLYLKRLTHNIMEKSEIIIELRSDNNGNPSDGIIASAKKNLTDTTLTYNWINFKLNKSSTLAKGKYWIVTRITQPTTPLVSDVVNIHYTSIDKTKPGNANHRQMDLKRNDKKGIWEQTSWKPLAYDKRYLFKMSTN